MSRRHLNQLEELGVLTKVLVGTEHFYVHKDLFDLFGIDILPHLASRPTSLERKGIPISLKPNSECGYH